MEIKVNFLFVSFVLAVLKMAGILPISWTWVLAPLWIPLGLSLLLFAIAGVLYGIASILD